MPSYAEAPLAWIEDPNMELERIRSLRVDDPIGFQDAMNTSRAFVDAAKQNDLQELRRVVEDSEQGELLQPFVLQAFVLSIKATSLEIVEQMVAWGLPLHCEQLSQSLHLVCELVDRENFSNAWRILKLLVEGNSEGGIHINIPRSMDGFTPLCVACANACLPLAFKLMEMQADPNVITRENDTPIALARRILPHDTEEQTEARGIIANMLRSYGAQDTWREALKMQARTPNQGYPRSIKMPSQEEEEVVAQPISSTHTRYTG